MRTAAVSDCKDFYCRAMASGKSYAMINMNIKKFRYMNHVYGREEADKILQDVEELIQAYLQPDDIITRKEADDFILLVSYTSRQELERIWLYKLVDSIFDIDNKYVYHNIYTSFGIYFIESAAVPFAEAFEKARFCRLMCDSLDRRVFSYEIYKQATYDKYIRNCYLEEYTAKAKDQGMYRVYIQPKIDLKTRKIIGGEALLRLQDHENLLPASEFLPMLNKNGFIRIIDYYVFKTVVEQLKERENRKKENVRISFNISNSFFKDVYYIDEYAKTVKENAIDPRYLEIEFMENIDIHKDILKKNIRIFHEMGFSCSLDDFGNGFSNFEILKECDLDIIKIDRCFFVDELSDLNKEILKTIIHLIKSIGMKVIAEGVERKEDVDFLASIGCDAVQGFYFYKPMPMEEFFSLLDNPSVPAAEYML